MAPALRERLAGERLSQTLYYVSLAAWMAVAIANTSLFAAYIPYKAVRLGLYCLLAASELAKGRYSVRSVAALALAGMVMAANLDSSYNAIDVVLYAVVGRSFDHKQTARVCLAVMVATVAVVVVSADVGLIANHVEIGGQRVREFLGFVYMLYPSQYAFAIVCLVAYVRSRCFSWADLAFCVGLSTYMYGRTISRMSFLLSVCTAVAVWACAFLVRWRQAHADSPGHLERIVCAKGWTYVAGVVVVASTAVCALVSMGMTLAFDESIGWMAKLDAFTVLSGRMRYGQEAIQKFGVPLLGQQISLVGNGLVASGDHVVTGAYDWVDCMYVKMLIENGVLVSAVFVVLATMVGWHAYKTRDVGLMVCVVMCAAHGILDELCFMLQFNPLLLLAGLPFADEGGPDLSMPRLARRLPGAASAMSMREALAFVAHMWLPMLVCAAACGACVWIWATGVPTTYRAQAHVAVSTKSITAETIARKVMSEAQTKGTWLHAGSNVSAGSIFITTQGPDAAWCEELANRTAYLTKLYVARNASTATVTSTLSLVQGVEALRPNAQKLAVAAAGVGACGVVMACCVRAGLRRSGRWGEPHAA